MQPKSIVKNENKKSEEKIIKAIEKIKIRDIKKLFEQEDSYKPLIPFWKNNCIEYESNYNKTLSIKECLD